MRKKIKNTRLFVVFMVLLVLVVVLFSRKEGYRERSFDRQLIQVETENISKIRLYPKVMNGESFDIENENAGWKLVKNKQSFKANNSQIEGMLSTLKNLEAKSIVANSKERWEHYEVSDSLASRVQLFDDNKVVADLYIGKFQFVQPRGMFSYVRPEGSKETYKVEGFLGSTFNRKLNDLRDKTLIDDRIANWKQLSFDYPGDSSFVLSKSNDIWMLGNVPADSAAVAAYINKLKVQNANSIYDEAVEVAANTYRLTIERENLEAIQLTVKSVNGEKVLSSSENAGVWFNDDTKIGTIFVSQSTFRSK
ncbi:DUF4340 domain-containing protein [Roseimarinus sediminis]|uniref:DUF4340 domain-containing protein n=1 Tax=Roseimarinus sediminis TaxID=1610899 RepID=UPI003D2412E6